jgi:hypothetical protein
MKQILGKLLSTALAILNWAMFLAGLGGAITFFLGEVFEVLPADSMGIFLKCFFLFLRKSSATFFVGGAAGLFFGFMMSPFLCSFQP